MKSDLLLDAMASSDPSDEDNARKRVAEDSEAPGQPDADEPHADQPLPGPSSAKHVKESMDPPKVIPFMKQGPKEVPIAQKQPRHPPIAQKQPRHPPIAKKEPRGRSKGKVLPQWRSLQSSSSSSGSKSKSRSTSKSR